MTKRSLIDDNTYVILDPTKSGAQGMDPLKNFADAAREELRPFVTR
jgi:hypothetical protein